MHNNQLIKTNVKFYDQLINQLPFLYDQYASSEVIKQAQDIKQANSKRKVIELKPLFHRKTITKDERRK